MPPNLVRKPILSRTPGASLLRTLVDGGSTMEIMSISRAFTNILTDDVAATREFYVDLLGLTVAFDSDWFVNLTTADSSAGELGIWRRDHKLIPNDWRQPPGGMVLTFVVDDVDAVHADAIQRGLSIVAEPRNLFYGQRQMLLTDPNGTLVDISTPVGMSEEFAATLVQDGDTFRQQRPADTAH